MTQIQVSNVAVQFGATVLFRDITFTVASGERWGIIGRNGTGKTTLFRLLTGELQPTRGTIVRQSALRVALLDQHRDFGDAGTVSRGRGTLPPSIREYARTPMGSMTKLRVQAGIAVAAAMLAVAGASAVTASVASAHLDPARNASVQTTASAADAPDGRKNGAVIVY